MQPRLKRSALLLALALQGCSLAPTYKTPDLQLPAHYREQSSDGPWHSAQPADQLSPQWWRVYQDERLNSLQQQLLKANPDLAAALAHFDAAQAYASQLHAGLFPQVSASGQPLRQRQSDNRPLRGSTQPSVYNSNTAGFALNFSTCGAKSAIKWRQVMPRPRPRRTIWPWRALACNINWPACMCKLTGWMPSSRSCPARWMITARPWH